MEFDLVAASGAEQVVFCHDAASGLRAIIAVHSTALGPALGGCRFHPYASDLDALVDVLRLAEGMTAKAACASLDLGGGKAVIIGDPRHDKSEALLRAFGRHVASLGGRYVTAEDVGTTGADMDLIRRETRWVTGVSPHHGGAGDPSPHTALGLMHALRAAAEHRWGTPELRNRRVIVQGCGKVGSAFVGLLTAAGARVDVADVDELAVARCVRDFGAHPIDNDTAIEAACDVYAPCALGGVLDDDTAERLGAELVCGSANNQLVHDGVAATLAKRDICYAPDFVVNAGGLITVADELHGYVPERAAAAVAAIGARTTEVLERAAAEAIPTVVAARRFAADRIAQLARLRDFHLPSHLSSVFPSVESCQEFRP